MLVRLDESGSGGFDDFEGARIAVIKLADQVFHFRILLTVYNHMIADQYSLRFYTSEHEREVIGLPGVGAFY